MLPLSSLNFLIGANAIYFTVVGILLAVVFDGPKQRPMFRSLARSGVLRNIIAAYNVVCIALAACVVVMITQYKLASWQADVSGTVAHVVCTKVQVNGTSSGGGASGAGSEGTWLLNAIWLFYGQKFWEYVVPIFLFFIANMTGLSLSFNANYFIFIGFSFINFSNVSGTSTPCSLSSKDRSGRSPSCTCTTTAASPS